MQDLVIIVPTNSSYIDIVNIFLQLIEKQLKLRKNQILISVTGQNIKIQGYKSIYNGEKASLIECVINAAKNSDSQYYVSFLGDAFITKSVDQKHLNNIVNVVKEKGIDYCSLSYVKRYTKEKKLSKELRLINNKDRYSHSFVAFIASKAYINDTLSKYKSDVEFEKYYLSKTSNDYFDNHAIVRKNYLNIHPSIVKGKWDIINYRRIRKKYPEINLGDREQTSYIYSLILHIREHIIPYIPNTARKTINKFRKDSI